MPITTVFRFKNHALMMALAAVYPAFSYGAGAARLDFASGNVTAVSAAGAQRGLNKGAEVGSGEAVVTGDGGRAQLRFTDGGMVSLQPGSEFKIDNYRFSGKEDGEEKGFFSLLRGGLRSITGLVGRNNKSAYKVTTNVATIGIRGTEFTIAYTGANSIAVSTGEGMIEVCNNAGCALVPAGSSATVSGPNTRIERSDVKPRLDPAQPPVDVQPVFSTAENRQGNGLIAPVSAPLPSGSNYAVAYVMDPAGYPYASVDSPATAVFDANSILTSFTTSGGVTNKASEIVGAFTMDGVIGWGRWSSGSSSYGSGTPLAMFDYVAGVPTAIGGLTGTADFLVAGGTRAYHASSGTLGGIPTEGIMKVDFGSSTITNFSLLVPIGSGKISISDSAININPNGTFTGYSADIAGFFAGTNASHAGAVYKTDGSSVGLPGDVTGAVVFKRK